METAATTPCTPTQATLTTRAMALTLKTPFFHPGAIFNVFAFTTECTSERMCAKLEENQKSIRHHNKMFW